MNPFYYNNNNQQPGSRPWFNSASMSAAAPVDPAAFSASSSSSSSSSPFPNSSSVFMPAPASLSSVIVSSSSSTSSSSYPAGAQTIALSSGAPITVPYGAAVYERVYPPPAASLTRPVAPPIPPPREGPYAARLEGLPSAGLLQPLVPVNVYPVEGARPIAGVGASAIHGTPRKVLIIMSGEDHVDLLSGTHKETGFFLSELSYPYLKLHAQGYQTVFANPNGRVPHLDPMSDSTIWFGLSKDQFERAKASIFQDPSFLSPIPFSQLTESDLREFRGVFIPGGHAPMQDLIGNPDVGRILTHFHVNMKPTGAICHGAAALLPARAANKAWIYADYKMCCYSNKEEWATECYWWDSLPLKLETLLKESGAVVLQGFPLQSRVVTDRELLTGQNPRSVEAFAELFLEKLNAMS